MSEPLTQVHACMISPENSTSSAIYRHMIVLPLPEHHRRTSRVLIFNTVSELYSTAVGFEPSHMSDGYCGDIENDEKNDEKMTNSCGKMAGNRSSTCMEPTCVISLHHGELSNTTE